MAVNAGPLPAATKAKLERQVLLEEGLLRCGPPEDGGLPSQSPAPPLSAGGGFARKERGTEQRSREGFAKFSTCRREQSVLLRQVTVQCLSPWLSHLGPTVEGQQISQSLDAGRSGLSLLKLVSSVLLPTGCSSSSYASEPALAETVRRTVGGLQLPTVAA